MNKQYTRRELEAIIDGLLYELRYIIESGDIRDSERNSVDLRDSAAAVLGYAGYSEYAAANPHV